jgi:micrococcal nuclease
VLRALCLTLCALAVAGCSAEDLENAAAPAGGDARLVRVTRVVDGDTLVVTGDERVRLIGVDTPETKKPGTPVQCFGRKATALTERLIDGRRVRLELDVEHRDRYGRLLAYVRRAGDGLFLNAELVRRGYATALTVPPDVRYADRFVRLAREARQAGRGLWSACPG